MKKSLIVALGVALGLLSCSPETLTMHLEMRYPSKSGLDLSRKSIAVVCMDDSSGKDSLFNTAVATGLSRSLEKDYFGGDEAIDIFRIPQDSVTLDLVHSLVMETGSDVIFLLNSTSLGAVELGDNVAVTGAENVDSSFVSRARIPFRTRLSLYDSMGKEDRLFHYDGASALRPAVYNNGLMAGPYLEEKALRSITRSAEAVGAQISNQFLPTWKEESYSLYYYSTWDNEWVEAAYHAFEYHWPEAVKIWTKEVNTNNEEKRACACYNIALAFYMMGDMNLATRWLDQADQALPLALSPGLRKRINERK